MNIIWKGHLCEVINLGFDKYGHTLGYRLYCEGISKDREKHILDNLNVEYLVQSKTNNQYDGALMVDFNPEDLQRVLGYFGIKNVREVIDAK